MRSDNLTRDQARALKNKLAPMLGYLGRLKKRMARRGFQTSFLVGACLDEPDWRN